MRYSHPADYNIDPCLKSMFTCLHLKQFIFVIFKTADSDFFQLHNWFEVYVDFSLGV